MTAMENSASQMIDQRIRELDDWRGSVLKQMRALIHEADPEVVEEWKWVKESSPGTPVWSHDGGICTGEAYKQVVKLTFFHGASLKDPGQLFNSSLGGNTRRAIDIREDDAIDEAPSKSSSAPLSPSMRNGRDERAVASAPSDSNRREESVSRSPATRSP
jgi:hypothetical protein